MSTAPHILASYLAKYKVKPRIPKVSIVPIADKTNALLTIYSYQDSLKKLLMFVTILGTDSLFPFLSLIVPVSLNLTVSFFLNIVLVNLKSSSYLPSPN